MVRRPPGFTIVEIIVVLLLMSIIGATLLSRSVTTSDTNLASQTDIIRNHLRYAQSMAMKRTDTVWGIKFDTMQSEYWLFRGTSPDNVSDQVRLPGVDYAGSSNKAHLASGVSLSTDLDQATLFFDRIGKPYSPNSTTQITNQKTVTVSASENRTITITPETGLIR